MDGDCNFGESWAPPVEIVEALDDRLPNKPMLR